MPGMFGYDRVRGCQTESGADRLGSEVWIEYSREDIGGDAAAVIADGDPDIRARVGSLTIAEDHVRRPYFNDSALRHGLPGIEEDIVENLADLAGVDFGRPEIDRNVDVDADRSARAREVDGILDEFGDRNDTADGSATLGKNQQLRGKESRALTGARGPFQDLLKRVVRTQLRKHNQNITHAARAMGIERGHMQRLMKRYGVERESC